MFTIVIYICRIIVLECKDTKIKLITEIILIKITFVIYRIYLIITLYKLII